MTGRTLTTGQAARYLGICRNCVVRHIDLRGKLQALPRPTPTSHRRIPVQEVIEYMTRNRMEIPKELIS